MSILRGDFWGSGYPNDAQTLCRLKLCSCILTMSSQVLKGLMPMMASAFFLEQPGMDISSSKTASLKNFRIMALSGLSSSWNDECLICVGLYTGTSTVKNTISQNTGAYSFQFLMVCLSVFCKTQTTVKPPKLQNNSARSCTYGLVNLEGTISWQS